MCMAGGGGVARSGGAYQPTYQQYNALKAKAVGGSWIQRGTKKVGDQTYMSFSKSADNAAASRGTGSQNTSLRWVLMPPKPKPVVKPTVVAKPKTTPAVPILPTDKVTNKPGNGGLINGKPNRLFPDRGQGAYDNVAKWGETYYRSNMRDEEDRIAKLGRGKYVGAGTTLGSATA